jgi:hypothetical protein
VLSQKYIHVVVPNRRVESEVLAKIEFAVLRSRQKGAPDVMVLNEIIDLASQIVGAAERSATDCPLQFFLSPVL